MDKYSKIGIFDSGLGGLSVLNTLEGLLSKEGFIYIGDSLNAPYGTRSKEEVFELSKKICDDLVSKDVKAIVIACNTATSAAVLKLRDMYDIPIVGMEPAVKPALRQSEGQVVVLATEMTLKEEKFLKLVDHIDDGYRVAKMPAPEWVDCVENHLHDEDFVKNCVDSFLDEKLPSAQNLVLGCTHFIFLSDYIKRYYNDKIELFDGNMGTALQLKNTLESMKLLLDEDIYQASELERIEIYNSKSDEYVEKSKDLLKTLKRGK
ncbi:glutamate racemase [Fusibacter bizertensis]|uniref:Glutamate racemase n=1 Tax=Fusibacter bizertensis TaxID=1488331 RepID=A0ABT6NDF9_9FIRM|nr:glutamate racemase [Fusibacter bizertensis]MDH8678457.1 glutamate racemase [Fusibacter bizertensis]